MIAAVITLCFRGVLQAARASVTTRTLFKYSTTSDLCRSTKTNKLIGSRWLERALQVMSQFLPILSLCLPFALSFRLPLYVVSLSGSFLLSRYLSLSLPSTHLTWEPETLVQPPLPPHIKNVLMKPASISDFCKVLRRKPTSKAVKVTQKVTPKD